MEIKPRKLFNEETEQANIEKLRSKFGHRKTLPRGYELPALIALCHYPELAFVAIDFIFKETDTILSSKPKPLSIFLPGRLRTYEVVISKKAKSSKEPVLLKNLDFNMQIGVIGHELGHISDYIRKSLFEIIRFSILYMMDSFKKKAEKRTDRITIKHGLGYQILSYAKLVEKLKKEYPDETYYQQYSKYYLSAAEIEARMGRMHIYADE
ncbi:MAG: hypothetical protein ACXWDO_04335 [Bacteroidia bacterium]